MSKQEVTNKDTTHTERKNYVMLSDRTDYASREHPEVLIHIPNDQNERPRMFRITNREQVKFLNTSRYEWESEDDEIVWQDYFTHDKWILVNPAHLELGDYLNDSINLRPYNVRVVSDVSETEECILWSVTFDGVTMMSALLLAFQEHLNTTYAQVSECTTLRMWTLRSAKFDVALNNVDYRVTVTDLSVIDVS